MMQSVRELFESIQDETTRGCPHEFILKDIRTNHLKKHWSNLALILVYCFDGNKGGIGQISTKRWMMMSLLKKKFDWLETHFNWGEVCLEQIPWAS